MKVLGIDHIGVAVNSIEKAMDFYRRALNMELGGGEDIPERHLKVGFLETGDARIELIEATSEEAATAKYIAQRGEGIHHICIRVDDIEAALEQFKAEGFRLIDETAKPGAEGAKVAFVHPKSSNGVLIELKELPE